MTTDLKIISIEQETDGTYTLVASGKSGIIYLKNLTQADLETENLREQKVIGSVELGIV